MFGHWEWLRCIHNPDDTIPRSYWNTRGEHETMRLPASLKQGAWVVKEKEKLGGSYWSQIMEGFEWQTEKKEKPLSES